MKKKILIGAILLSSIVGGTYLTQKSMAGTKATCYGFCRKATTDSDPLDCLTRGRSCAWDGHELAEEKI